MKYALLPLLILMHFSVFSKGNPKKFYSFKDSKVLAYVEEFEDESNFSEDIVHNENYDYDKLDYELSNGVLKCFAIQKSHSAFPEETSIDFNSNYEIHIRMRVTGDSTFATGIFFWGRNDSAQHGQYIYLRNDSTLNMFYQKGNDEMPVLRNVFTITDVYTWKFRNYMIRKHDNYYYVFINGVFNYKVKFSPLNGKNIGIGAGNYATAEVDYIKIYQLPE